MFHKLHKYRQKSHTQSGFAISAALFLIVILAILGAVTWRLVAASAEEAALDAQGKVALMAARAGQEVGLYRVLRQGTCAAETFTVSDFSDFTIAVVCSRVTENEGGTSLDIFTITSTACNRTACPAAAASGSYVERQISVQVTQ